MKNYTKAILRKKPKTNKFDYELINHILSFSGLSDYQDKIVVDIGCGEGKYKKVYKEFGFNYIGLDRSESASTSFICDFGKDKLPFENDSVDIFFCKSVLEHMYINEHAFLLEEIKRCLKKNGILILLIPDFNTCSYVFYNVYSHVTPFTYNSTKSMLQIYDFKIQHLDLIHFIPITWKKNIGASVKFICLIIRNLGIKTKPLLIPKTNFGKFIRWSNELQIFSIAKKN